MPVARVPSSQRLFGLVQQQLLPQLLLLCSPRFGALHLRDLLAEDATQDEQQVAVRLMIAIGIQLPNSSHQPGAQQPGTLQAME